MFIRLTVLAATLIALAAASTPAFAASQRPVCPGPASKGAARCHARVIVDRLGKPQRTTAPTGYGPADLQSAYKVTGGSNTPGTIAIVDAYHDPTAETDLATYRKQFGLTTCTSQSGCFRQINQRGVTGAPPATDGGWAQEISLDLDMASAMCPACKIVLVEADNAYFSSLSAAVQTAAAQPGVIAISNSYGGSEFSTESSYESAYNQPGKAVTVSSGDSGYGVEFPASSQYVISVGGTSLTKATSAARGWTESAWSGAGSGCSSYIAKPSFQGALSSSLCGNRAVADVSAVADPNTGVAVYDSTSYQGRSGWMKFGGTSAGAPIIGALYARANDGKAQGSLYAAGASLFDITSGSNGSCGGTALCGAGSGWDGPTGVGTPNGLSAF